jgi:hypothetical protein
MKKIIAQAVSMLAFVFVLSAAGYSETILTADVPFAFNVGQKRLPAGTYRVVTVNESTLNLRSENGSFMVSVIGQPMGSGFGQSDPKLKFTVEDGRYVLSEIRPAGATSGFLLFSSKHPKSNLVTQTQNCGTVASNSLPNSGK